MELQEILEQPEGFTPPSVTVTIEKVFAYKCGESENGAWSFQDIQGSGGKLKLKNFPEFPQSRVGQTVTIKANQSKTHGLTGLKVAHEQYQGKTYDKLIITPSAKWEWAAPNGNGTQPVAAAKPIQDAAQGVQYADHILGCAELANIVVAQLEITDPQAMQACFATICIDTKNRNILLPGPKTLPSVKDEETPQDDPFEEETIPF